MANAPLPPLPLMQQALRLTTQTLVRNLTSDCAATPAWSSFEWQIAKASAAMHGITALLAGRLRWMGPSEWHEFLDEQRHQTELRVDRIRSLWAIIQQRFERAGVPAVALKGSALYLMGIYESATRPMADVDLLVRPVDVPEAARLICSVGYTAGAATDRHVTFNPHSAPSRCTFGEHSDNPIKIELHTRIYELLPATPIDITAAVFPASPVPGLQVYPSKVALLMHVMLHTTGSIRSRTLRFIQLNDIAQLAAELSSQDWQSFERYWAERPDQSSWIFAALHLTNRYFPRVLPDRILQFARHTSTRLLRHCASRYELTDISWSNIRIEALPGIEFSSSAMDAARFVRHRMLPSRRTREQLRAATDVTVNAHIPWYGQSQLRRVLRWLTTNPPRVQTMYCVRCVLGDDPDAIAAE